MTSSQYTPKMIPSTRPNVPSTSNMVDILSGHHVNVFEHLDRETQPHGLEPLGAFRPDAGRAEAASHLALRRKSRAFEAEDFLHRDDVLLHPGELRDRRHF